MKEILFRIINQVCWKIVFKRFLRFYSIFFLDCTTGQVYFPDITNETKYYICTGGKALLMTCPLGYKWDTDIFKCDLLVI